MSLVVCGIHPSVHAAYKAKAVERSVSTTSLYNKLSGIELGVSQALVRETANAKRFFSRSNGWRTTKFVTGVSTQNSGWNMPSWN